MENKTGGSDEDRERIPSRPSLEDEESLLREDLRNLGLDPTISLDDGPDTDSQEDVLQRFNLVDDDEEAAEPYERPLLVERMSEEVSIWLSRLTVTDADKLETEDFLEFCEKAGIMPEQRVAATAFTDLVLEIEREDYQERALSGGPSLSDLAEACETIDDIDELQQRRTREAYMFLRNFIRDPILELPFMIEKRESILEKRPERFEEYEEIQEELEALSGEIEKLTEIEEVKERRERAFRAMTWLLKQDYLGGFVKNLRSLVRKGHPIDFDLVAGSLAGRYDPVEGTYYPGVIEELLQKHEEQMGEAEKTDRQKQRDAVKLRRLEQAMALCEYIFKEDVADRIYAGTPITPEEFKKLEFIRRRLYVDGDTKVLDNFIAFLPGSPLQDTENREIYEVSLPRKFSGRSLKDLFGEIDDIINQHPALDIDRMTELVEAKAAGLTTSEHDVELAIDALVVLEKLAYRENHSVRGLMSE